MSSYPQAPDPGHDPRGFLVDLLGRHFPPGLVESTIRTWVPITIGALLSWINANYTIAVLPNRPSATAVIVATGVVTAGYYALARVVERRFPRVGQWMLALNLVKAKPVYATPAETVRIVGPDGVRSA